MIRIIIIFLALLIPQISLADPMTKAEMFALYVELVPQETTAMRLQQIYDNLPAGAFKTQVKDTLISDLTAILDARAAYFDSMRSSNADQSTEVDDVEF